MDEDKLLKEEIKTRAELRSLEVEYSELRARINVLKQRVGDLAAKRLELQRARIEVTKLPAKRRRGQVPRRDAMLETALTLLKGIREKNGGEAV